MFYDTVKALLARYGQPVTVILPQNSIHQYSATIQPLRYKNKMYLEGDYQPLGQYDADAYLYIGPGDTSIGENIKAARLVAGDAEYYFTRADTIRLKNSAVYTWAVIKPVINVNQ